MNLAIEYLLRSGELKHRLKFPYSVFMSNMTGGEKIVMTIHQKIGNPDRLIVKHWLLSECRPEQRIPPFVEHEINRADLFCSPLTILPRCELLWYAEETYPGLNWQSTDLPFSERQQVEYNSIVDNFLFSARHRKVRDEWLWTSFLSVYASNASLFLRYFDSDRLKVLSSHAPHLRNHWVMWRKYLLDYSTQVGDIAGELLFQKEYESQVRRSNNGSMLFCPDMFTMCD